MQPQGLPSFPALCALLAAAERYTGPLPAADPSFLELRLMQMRLAEEREAQQHRLLLSAV
jgi:hypothetical protein